MRVCGVTNEIEAEKGHGEPYIVEAILVAYEMPENSAAFAEKFGIRSLRILTTAVPTVYLIVFLPGNGRTQTGAIACPSEKQITKPPIQS